MYVCAATKGMVFSAVFLEHERLLIHHQDRSTKPFHDAFNAGLKGSRYFGYCPQYFFVEESFSTSLYSLAESKHLAALSREPLFNMSPVTETLVTFIVSFQRSAK